MTQTQIRIKLTWNEWGIDAPTYKYKLDQVKDISIFTIQLNKDSTLKTWLEGLLKVDRSLTKTLLFSFIVLSLVEMKCTFKDYFQSIEDISPSLGEELDNILSSI